MTDRLKAVYPAKTTFRRGYKKAFCFPALNFKVLKLIETSDCHHSGTGIEIISNKTNRLLMVYKPAAVGKNLNKKYNQTMRHINYKHIYIPLFTTCIKIVPISRAKVCTQWRMSLRHTVACY